MYRRALAMYRRSSAAGKVYRCAYAAGKSIGGLQPPEKCTGVL